MKGAPFPDYDTLAPVRGRPMDTTLTIERIRHALDKRFGGLIGLSDLRPEASVEYPAAIRQISGSSDRKE